MIKVSVILLKDFMLQIINTKDYYLSFIKKYVFVLLLLLKQLKRVILRQSQDKLHWRCYEKQQRLTKKLIQQKFLPVETGRKK